MTPYKNNLTLRGCENINSNLINQSQLNSNRNQKSSSSGFFGRDITNTPSTNNNVSNSFVQLRLTFDSEEDFWNMDSDEKNFSLSTVKSNKMRDTGFDSRSGSTSSGSDSPTRYPDQESENMSSPSHFLTIEQSSSSDEFSGMDCASSSSSSSSSMVKTNTGNSNKRSANEFDSDSVFELGNKLRKLTSPNKINVKEGNSFSPVTQSTHNIFSNRPKKTNPFVEKLLDVLQRKAFTFSEKIKREEFPYDEIKRSVTFRIDEKKGMGDFSEVFTLFSDQQVVLGYTNEQLLLKRYHQKMIGLEGARLEQCIDRSLEQYNYLVNEKPDFAVAKIFNAESVKSDLYFLVERIPHEFMIDCGIDTNFEDLSVKDKYLLSQVKKMFQFSFDHNICLDVKRDNIRIDDNGQPVLCDFLEIKRKLIRVIENQIDSFARGSESIRQYLRPEGYVQLV